jgi:acetyl esterase
MALDRQAQEVVDLISVGLNPPPPMLSSVFNARNLPSVANAAREAATNRGDQAGFEPVGGITHVQIPARDGAEVLARVYTPAEGEEPFPVLVYYHGGGWVLFDLDTYDASCRGLANAAGCVVVSVAYRQAPEFKFPTAHNDTYDAYVWVRDNAPEVGGDPDRVAVGGESVGGNMAAATALRARNEGAPPPVHQLLVYPVTNHAFDTPSYEEQAEAVPLSRELMQWFFEQYLPDPSDGDNHYVSPLRAEDHGGLPPATVITAEQDPLTSEGEAYANVLREAGVPVEYAHYEGTMHEFFSMPMAIYKAREAINLAARELRSAFEGGGAAGGAATGGTQPPS